MEIQINLFLRSKASRNLNDEMMKTLDLKWHRMFAENSVVYSNVVSGWRCDVHTLYSNTLCVIAGWSLSLLFDWFLTFRKRMGHHYWVWTKPVFTFHFHFADQRFAWFSLFEKKVFILGFLNFVFTFFLETLLIIINEKRAWWKWIKENENSFLGAIIQDDLLESNDFKRGKFQC